MNGRTLWRSVPPALVALPWIVVTPAAAHTIRPGVGAWLDGAARLALEPTDLLLAIALVLLADQQGNSTLIRVRALLPVTWLVGAIAGLAVPVFFLLGPFAGGFYLLLNPFSTGLFTVFALLVSLRVPVPSRLLLVLVVLSAAAFGLVKGSLLGGHDAALPLLFAEGISLAAVVWLMAAVLEHLRFGWRTIAVRVVGSWIAAAGLLMLGWQLRGGQGAG